MPSDVRKTSFRIEKEQEITKKHWCGQVNKNVEKGCQQIAQIHANWIPELTKKTMSGNRPQQIKTCSTNDSQIGPLLSGWCPLGHLWWPNLLH